MAHVVAELYLRYTSAISPLYLAYISPNQVLPFALGLPAHVGGVGHEVHGSESSAEAADVPAELISALRHHNHLDLELFRHAG